MSKPLKRNAAVAGVAVACTAAITACGGGGGSGATPGDGLTEAQREDRLASSWPGMLTFALAQIARPDADTAESRQVAGIAPPQSDIDEPSAL